MYFIILYDLCTEMHNCLEYAFFVFQLTIDKRSMLAVISCREYYYYNEIVHVVQQNSKKEKKKKKKTTNRA